jgi:hypothetical protein
MIGKKAVALTALLIVLGAGIGYSQSNEVVDRVLQQDALQAAEAVYLVQVAAGNVEESASVQQAYEQFEWSSVNLEALQPDATLTVGQYSYLIMHSLDLSGGIMYKIFPGPRYAARELHFLGHITQGRSPYRDLSGNEALSILGSVLRGEQS